MHEADPLLDKVESSEGWITVNTSPHNEITDDWKFLHEATRDSHNNFAAYAKLGRQVSTI